VTDTHSIANLLVVLAAILAAGKLLAALAQRIGQPAVLGELLAGVLLGRSVFGLLDPTDVVIHSLSELGVIILLFEIGLHTDIKSIARVFGAATAVAVVGVVLPFALGYAAVVGALGLDKLSALVCAAALTATSIGISARVLSDIGLLKSAEGQVVLGAAVLDDIIGLIVLSVTVGIVTEGSWSMRGVILTTAISIGFVVIALTAGRLLARPVFKSVEAIKAPGTLAALALAFALVLSSIAATSGSAMILGAFAAGMILNTTDARADIERAVTSIGHFLVPVFFASVGAAVDLSTFRQRGTLGVATVLIVAGVAGKYLAGYAPWWFRGNKKLIGVAMIPRGEVGLIFAQMGLSTMAITPSLFSAITLMVLVTTFLAPPLLSRVSKAQGGTGSPPDDAGIDDLVVGDLGHRSRHSLSDSRPTE
jgi:Kef-type K+ transport system membrane component KefB